MKPSLHVGVDFDNTLVCYDDLFQRVAREQGLVPAAVPASKEAVRDHLRATGHETEWTALQGLVYGPRLAEARPFAGALEVLHACAEAGVRVSIISHKTEFPAVGPRWSLHAAARTWLAAHGLAGQEVFFEPTQDAKLARLVACGCTHLVDDLLEFLARPDMPADLTRLWFAPTSAQPTPAGIARVRSWSEVSARLLPAPEGPGVVLAAERLASQAGHRGPVTLEPIPGAGNNRVYRLAVGDQSLLLKAYFHHPADTRDRLGAEWAFARLAWDSGVRVVPQPLARDLERRLGLYEFIAGARLAPGEPTDADVAAAGEFLRALNAQRATPAAATLALAADACLTFRDHLSLVERRLARLAAIDTSTPLGAEAAAWVGDVVAPRWTELRATSLAAAADLGLDPAAPLPPERRILSPSDFGFHNALRLPDGSLRFLDFEYAGWDDPAKLAGDFRCQPAVPVTPAQADAFAAALLALTPDPAREARRWAILAPVHRLKWCCLLLNEFLPVGAARRQFAGAADDLPARRSAQLAKSRAMLGGGDTG